MLQLLHEFLAEVLELRDSTLINLELLLQLENVVHSVAMAARGATVALDDRRRTRGGSATAAPASRPI